VVRKVQPHDRVFVLYDGLRAELAYGSDTALEFSAFFSHITIRVWADQCKQILR